MRCRILFIIVKEDKKNKLEYVKPLLTFIDVDVDSCNDIFKSFMNPTHGEGKHIAIIIRGQLRSFFKESVYKSLNSFIDRVREQNYEPVCFFYVNKKSSYDHDEWHYTKAVRNGFAENIEDAKNKIRDIYAQYDKDNETKFKSIVSELSVKCVFEFYDEDLFVTEREKFKKQICPSLDCIVENVHYFQHQLNRYGFKMVECYETEHNIKFDKVITTRPDLTYNNLNNFYIPKSDNEVLWQWDLFRLFPRCVLDFLMKSEIFERLVKTNKNENIDYQDRQLINHLLDLLILKIVNVKKIDLIHIKLVKISELY